MGDVFDETEQVHQTSGDAARLSKPNPMASMDEATRSTSPSALNGNTTDSHFTHQDFRLMEESSVHSPLRIVALIDFDAFYAQCETVRLGLSENQPLAVQQWHAVIAINYPARSYGVKRGMTIEEVKLRCPNIKLQHVATWREGDSSWAYRADVSDHMRTDKAALEPYRRESRKAFALVSESLSTLPGARLEKGSIDEMFLDLSTPVNRIMSERCPHLSAATRELRTDRLARPSSMELDWEDDFVIGGQSVALDWDEVALNVGASIVRGIRRKIFQSLHYTTSAGVASNKVLAKLCAGRRKPDHQTVIPARNVSQLLSRTRYRELRGLGRDLGERVESTFGGETTADLLEITLGTMQTKLGPESGTTVYQLIRGQDFSEVACRTDIQSMLSQKTFVPNVAGLQEATRWLRIFAAELYGRITDLDTPSCCRRPRTLAVSHHIKGRFGPTRAKQVPIPQRSTFDADLIYSLSFAALAQLAMDAPSWPCAALGVRLLNFQKLEQPGHPIESYYSLGGKNPTSKKLPTKILSVQPRRQICEPGMPWQTKHGRKRLKIRDQASEDAAKSDGMPTTDERQSNGVPQPDGIYHCPNCGAAIPEPRVLEHLDWHVAKELQAGSSQGPE